MKQWAPKKLMILTMLFMTFTVSAANFTIKNLTNPSIESSSFPLFSSEKYPNSAANINTLLQYNMLDQVYEVKDFAIYSASPFRDTEDHRRNFYFYEYIINENTNYLEVSIVGDSCGAYCEEFTKTFIFDTYTGQLITLVDLLSPQGKIQLEDKIRATNLKRIEPYILNKPDSGLEEDVDMYFMYKYCYEDMKDDNSSSNEIDEDTSFTLSNNILAINHGRCSNHALRALDEIGTFVNKFTFDQLKPYLSQEGEKYLSNHPYQLPTIKTPYKVRYGKIDNKYPITIINSEMSGWVYWYDKYKTPIDLYKEDDSGTGSLILKESYYDEIKNKRIYTAKWEIKENNDMFSGTFTRFSDGKKMAVTFK